MLDKVQTLPPPTLCDCCCSVNVIVTTNAVLYGTSTGDDSPIYFCEDCRAAVGCHVGTLIPLGRMADKIVRKLRSKAHIEFDNLWKSGLMTREKAYDWLALNLGIDPAQCHIAWLTKDQLKDVATLSADYLAHNQAALIKRKAKHDAKQRDSNARARKQYQYHRNQRRP